MLHEQLFGFINGYYNGFQGVMFFCYELVFYFLPYTILPLLAAIFISKLIFARKLKFTIFMRFVICVLLLSMLASLLWNKFAFNHIYYQWDPHNITILLLGAESTYPFPPNWLAANWSMFSVEALFWGMLISIYSLGYLLSLFWLKKIKYVIPSSYHIAILATCILLFISAVGFSFLRLKYNGAFDSKIAFYQSKNCAEIDKPMDYQNSCLVEARSVAISKNVNWLGNYFREQLETFVETDQARELNLPKDVHSWDCAVDGQVIENWTDPDSVDSLPLEENKIYKCWPK